MGAAMARAGKRLRLAARQKWEPMPSLYDDTEEDQYEDAPPGKGSRHRHNYKERERRRDISGAVEAFRNVVPGCDAKTDKANVLRSAVGYLRYLHNIHVKSKQQQEQQQQQPAQQ